MAPPALQSIFYHVAATELTTDEAALVIGATPPTVRSLIESGRLTARRVPWGSRFKWRISKTSVDEYITTHGRRDDSYGRTTGRIDVLERKVAELAAGLTPARSDTAATEQDDLRARVVALEESLMRAREVAELQAAADRERAEVVRLLLDAVRAAERADDRRRKAIATLGEALGGYERPGHLGQLR